MGKVIASASMSLDGYIAKDDNSIGRLFDWYQNGEVVAPTATDDITFHLSAASAEYWNRWVSGLGAIVCGRTLFDFTDGWGGRHTMDAPVVVVTHQVPTRWVDAHPDAPFHFVTDGVAAAVAKAQEVAGDRTVAVAAGTIAGQCLQLGLLDEIAVDLVPVVMGGADRSSGRWHSKTSRWATRSPISKATASHIWCFRRGGLSRATDPGPGSAPQQSGDASPGQPGLRGGTDSRAFGIVSRYGCGPVHADAADTCHRGRR